MYILSIILVLIRWLLIFIGIAILTGTFFPALLLPPWQYEGLFIELIISAGLAIYPRH